MLYRRLLLLLLLPFILTAKAPYKVACILNEGDQYTSINSINNQNQVLGDMDGDIFFWSEGTGTIKFGEECGDASLNHTGRVLVRFIASPDRLQFWNPVSGFEEISLPLGVKTANIAGFNDSNSFTIYNAEEWIDAKSQYLYLDGSWNQLPEVFYFTRGINNKGELLFTDFANALGIGPAIYSYVEDKIGSWTIASDSFALDFNDEQDIVGMTLDNPNGLLFNRETGKCTLYSNYIPIRINNRGETLGMLPSERETATFYNTQYSHLVESLEMIPAAKLINDKEVEILGLTDINDRGWIVGFAKKRKKIVGVILKPNH